jgi:pyruvate dehydrogenase E1 component alpha subunit
MESTPWDPEGVTVVLDPDGRLSDGVSTTGLDLKVFYKHLVAARCLDLRLAREGLAMWASAAGEEAPLVAVGMVANAQDWVYPGARDAAIALARGVDYASLARQILGRDGAARSALPGRIVSPEHRIATTTDGLGLHLALAAGQAHGQRLTGDSGITFAMLGEGTTTTGAFHEATMLAVAADLPLVLVCRSQLWPDGAPAEAGLVGDAVAERARVAGLWVRRVDGADPIGVHAAVSMAAERARHGRGPGLVEVVVTQLQRDPPAHRDPVERLRRHLDVGGIWTQTLQDVIEAEIRTQLERAFVETPGAPS